MVVDWKHEHSSVLSFIHTSPPEEDRVDIEEDWVDIEEDRVDIDEHITAVRGLSRYRLAHHHLKTSG